MSDRSDAYDPGAPEGEVSGRGQYKTPRQLRQMLIGFVVIFLLLIPIYRFLLGRSQSSICTQNIKAIMQAMNIYAQNNDERFPPVARTESYFTTIPSLDSTGHVYTWASDLQPYMNARASFRCPAADDKELVATEDNSTNKKTIPLSYGMYAPYGGFLVSEVENPDQTVIISETSNEGSGRSYDPMPFHSSAGAPLPDGFAIGWNDSNEEPSSKTLDVTRLAFQGTQGGTFKKGGDARHGTTIHGLTASGQEIDIAQQMARFQSRATITPWRVPPVTQAPTK